MGFNLATNATFDAPQLASVDNAQVTLGAGATFKAPALASMTSSQLSLSPGRTFTFDPAKLSNAT